MSTSFDTAFGALRKEGLSPAELAEGKKQLQSFMQQVRPAAAERSTEHMAASSPPTHLTAQELHDGKAALRRFMAANPPLESMMDRMIWLVKHIMQPVTATAVLAVVSLGSVAYAAEGSLPGDPLYAVKIHVNEVIASQLYVGNDGQAMWAVHALQRRTQELEQLAKQPHVDDTRWVAMEQAASSAAADVERHLRMISPRQATVARSILRESIGTIAQRKIFDGTEGTEPPEQRILSRIESAAAVPTVAVQLLAPVTATDEHKDNDRHEEKREHDKQEHGQPQQTANDAVSAPVPLLQQATPAMEIAPAEDASDLRMMKMQIAPAGITPAVDNASSSSSSSCGSGSGETADACHASSKSSMSSSSSAATEAEHSPQLPLPIEIPGL